MPLSYAAPGEESVIRRIGGSPEVKKHLENLGFVVGGSVKVITALNGSVIVKVKEARVAINDDMAHLDKNTLRAVGQTIIQVLFSEK